MDVWDIIWKFLTYDSDWKYLNDWYLPAFIIANTINWILLLVMSYYYRKELNKSETPFSKYRIIIIGVWMLFLNDTIEKYSILLSNDDFGILGSTKNIFGSMGFILIISGSIRYLSDVLTFPEEKDYTKALNISTKVFHTISIILYFFFILNMITQSLDFILISAIFLMISIGPLLFLIVATGWAILSNKKYHSKLTQVYFYMILIVFAQLMLKFGFNLYKFIYVSTGSSHGPIPYPNPIYIFGDRVAVGHLIFFLIDPYLSAILLPSLLYFAYALRSHPNWLWKSHLKYKE